MKAKFKDGDKVWVRIKGARPKQLTIKSQRAVSLQSGTSILYNFGGSIFKYEHEIFKTKKGATTW